MIGFGPRHPSTPFHRSREFPYLHQRDVSNNRFGGYNAWLFSCHEVRCRHIGRGANHGSGVYGIQGTNRHHRHRPHSNRQSRIGGGKGTLTFNGKSYPLSIGGVSVGTIGVATVNLEGTARNLRTAADIAGTYGAASASVAIVGGGKVATLKNEKGVVLEVHGVQLGLEASLSMSGMTIVLQ